MPTREEISTESTTGEMPWDNLFDYSRYTKTQCKIKTIRYEVKENGLQGL